jgi:predicted Fe-Mo cluster-binding NifX family protein
MGEKEASCIKIPLAERVPSGGAEFRRRSMKTFMKQLICAGLAVSILMMPMIVLAGEGKTEKIAVAANGQTAAATVAAQPGRSPFFLLFDENGTLVQAVENPYKDQGGSGISTVDFLASKGVRVLVAAGYGPKIVEVMKGKGIRAVTFTGTAADAVKKLEGIK